MYQTNHEEKRTSMTVHIPK